MLCPLPPQPANSRTNATSAQSTEAGAGRSIGPMIDKLPPAGCGLVVAAMSVCHHTLKSTEWEADGAGLTRHPGACQRYSSLGQG